MVVGNRLKLRHVDPLQERAQPKRFGRRRAARTRGQRVAGVENHRAAVLHERGDARARLGLGLRQPGDDRPIDQRIESEFVARRIERRPARQARPKCGKPAPASAPSARASRFRRPTRRRSRHRRAGSTGPHPCRDRRSARLLRLGPGAGQRPGQARRRAQGQRRALLCGAKARRPTSQIETSASIIRPTRAAGSSQRRRSIGGAIASAPSCTTSGP